MSIDYKNYKELLADFVNFKSISTDSAFKIELEKSALWLKNLFIRSGFSVDLWYGPNSNPVVFAEYNSSPEFETVLIYGHYDVQPASKQDGWSFDPFMLNERDGKLYARGVSDNKGPVLIHIYSILNLIQQGKLGYNVKFIIEGNEETSNEDLHSLLVENKEKLNVNHILISDSLHFNSKPSIDYSLRGSFKFKLRYKTSKNNLHSGLYGGAVPNPAHELSNLVSKIYNDSAEILIPNFYNDVDEVLDSHLEAHKSLATNSDKILESIGLKEFRTEDKYDLITQVGLRPTIQVTGFKSGYIDKGYANIIPAEAELKINVRLVASQKFDKVIALVRRFIEENTPEYIDYDLEFSHGYNPVKVDITSDKIAEVRKIINQVFGEDVTLKPLGGGIPVVSSFKEVLNIDAILVSLANEDCNLHGVDENLDIDLIKKGIKFSTAFFSSG